MRRHRGVRLVDDNATPKLTAGEFVPKYLEEVVVRRGAGDLVDRQRRRRTAPAGRQRCRRPAARRHAGPAVRRHRRVLDDRDHAGAGDRGSTSAARVETTTRPTRSGIGADAGRRASTRRSPCGGSRGADGAGLALHQRHHPARTARSRSACGDRRSRPDRAAGAQGRGGPGAEPGRRSPPGPPSSGGGPAIDYNRLDPPGPRRPLPFLRNSGAARNDEVDAGKRAGATSSSRGRRAGTSSVHRRRVAAPGRRVRHRAGLVEGERRLGAAAARLARRSPGAARPHLVTRTSASPSRHEPVDTTVHPPVALAVLGAGTRLEGALVGGGTTVSDRPRASAGRAADTWPACATCRPRPGWWWRGSAGRTEQRSRLSTGCRVTRATRVAAARVARRGGAGPRPPRRDRRASWRGRGPRARRVRAGEILVLALPNAAHDVDEAGGRPELLVTGARRGS